MTQASALDSRSQTNRQLANLIEEITGRLAAGESVDLDTYAARYPEHAEQLEKLMPTLAALVDLGMSTTSGGAPKSPSPTPSQESDSPETQRGVLGDFRIVREVGRGGMGVVYEAEQISLGRRVALKVLPFAAMMDPRQLARFKTESQAAAHLQHTNIVPVHYVGCERSVHFYAMQYIEGQSLAEVVAQLRKIEGLEQQDDNELKGSDFQLGSHLASGRFAPRKRDGAEATTAFDPQLRSETPSPDTAAIAALSTEGATKSSAYFRTIANLGIQAAEALDHAHEQGIVHRDVKPANLMLDSKGSLWVTDFGLARIETDAGLTMTGDILGTLRYMSPEQALAKRVIVDHRTDVYSLGVTLYELLTLRPVFPGKDRQEVLRQIAFEEPKKLRKINPAIPADLDIIVHKAIEKNPEDRYSTAKDLADDLRCYLLDKPIRAKWPSLTLRATKWSRRHRSFVASAVVILVLGVCGLAISTALLSRRQAEIVRQRDHAREQKARALANLDLAQQAIDAAHLAVNLNQTTFQSIAPTTIDERARRRVLDFYRALSDMDASDPKEKFRKADALIHLGWFEPSSGKPNRDKSAYEEAIEIFQELVRLYPKVRKYRQGLVLAHTRIVNLWLNYNNGFSAPAGSEERLSALRKIAHMYEHLAQEFPGHRVEDLGSLANHEHWTGPERWYCDHPGYHEYMASEVHLVIASESSDRKAALVASDRALEFCERGLSWYRELPPTTLVVNLLNVAATTHCLRSEAHWSSGEKKEAKQEFVEAERLWQQAFELAPDFVKGLKNCAAAMQIHRAPEFRDLKRAVVLREEILQITPHRASSWLELSELLATSHDPEVRDQSRARSLIEMAITLNYGNAGELNNIAWRLVVKPSFVEPNQVVAIAENAVALAPENSSFLNTLVRLS